MTGNMAAGIFRYCTCRASPALLFVTLGCLLEGCVAYEAAPVDVSERAEALGSLQIDLDAVRATTRQIAPAYEWRNDEWNGLTLLAAALVTNPELARSRAAVATARADAEVARIAPGPTLSLVTEYAFNPTESSNWLYGIAADMLVDRGERRRGRIDVADIAARAAAYDYVASVWSVRQQIRRALDAHATWTVEAALSGQLVELRRRQFDVVRRQVDAGEVSRSELERVRSLLASDLQAETTARQSAARSILELAAAIGTPADAIDTTRIAAPDVARLAAVPPIGDDDVASALEGRTEILQAMTAYDRSEAELRIAVASQYPEVRVGPGYTWERGLSKLPLGVSLSFPTTDRAHAAIAAAEARRTEAGRQLEAAVAGVLSSIAGADADYRAAQALLGLVRDETLATATALAAQADLEFAAGAINRAEWAAAQAGLQAARIEEIAAVRRALDAETMLEGALRIPLRGAETAIARALASPPTDNNP